MSEAQGPEVQRRVDVEASPAEVWELIVDGELAEEWLGVTVDPRPGGAVTVRDADTIGTVEEVDPVRSITWCWRQPEGDPSQVTIDIEPLEEGSRVTVTERLLEYKITGSPPVFFALAA
jgi:uncharacterized protein YndB with AHSA1/START domain